MFPTYFEARFDPALPGFLISIAKELVALYQSFNDDTLLRIAKNLNMLSCFKKASRISKTDDKQAGFFDNFYQDLALSELRLLFGDFFAQENNLILVEKNSNFWVYEAVIPLGCQSTSQTCSHCRGGGIDLDWLERIGSEVPCHYCLGSGKVVINHDNLVFGLTNDLHSLSGLVDVLIHSRAKACLNQRPMQMFWHLRNEGYAGQHIYGYYTKEFRNFLLAIINNQSANDIATATRKIMIDVYDRLIYGDVKKRHKSMDLRSEFCVKIDKRGDMVYGDEGLYLLLQVNGQNGCSVYNDSASMIFPPSEYTEENIFSLTCHNIDHPKQQLSLLAGLAYLVGLANDWSEKQKNKNRLS